MFKTSTKSNSLQCNGLKFLDLVYLDLEIFCAPIFSSVKPFALNFSSFEQKNTQNVKERIFAFLNHEIASFPAFLWDPI